MYKIKFNDYQENVFSTVDFNGDKRNKLMSVYSYLIKYSNDVNVVSKSLNKLHKMYVRYHYKISNKYFYNLVDVLVDLDLLKKNNNKILIVQEKVQEKVQIKETTESIENTSVDVDFEKLKCRGIDYTYNSFTNIKFCGVGEFATKEELKEIAQDLYKHLKIKSSYIKTEVLNIISRYTGVIYKKSARDYLFTVILDKKLKREAERNNFYKKFIANKNKAIGYINGTSEYSLVNAKLINEIENLVY